MIDRKKVKQLHKDGMSMTKIAELMGCSATAVSNAVHDRYKPRREKKCTICGKTFMIAGKRRDETCGDDKCKKEYRSRWHKKRYLREKPPGSIREYTFSTNMFIVEDLLLGVSIREMSETYNRDLDDLKNHIATVLTPEVREKYKRRFSEYQRAKLRRALGGEERG